MNDSEYRSGRASAELPGLFPFWLSRYAGTLGRPSTSGPPSRCGEVAIEQLQRDLLAYYERQAQRLLHVASHCTDPKVQRELLDIASEYIEKLEHVSGEKPIQRPKPNALIVPPRRPPQTRTPLTKIREIKEAKAA
jgi:hypothetical protein